MAEGSHDGDYIDFYGQLKEIIELQYNSDLSISRTVVIFRCDWFDTNSKKYRMKDDGFFKSINHGRCWYKDDPFILATQATKVFFLKDTKHANDSKILESWRIVQKFSHRHLWNVAENIDDERPSTILSYQDDSCEVFQVQENLNDDEGNLDDEQPSNEVCVHVDAVVVDQLRSKSQEEKTEENFQSDDEDETGWQYVSEDEGPMCEEAQEEEEEDSDDDY
ncbi:unnamed protein product [Urochloa humidicola]